MVFLKINNVDISPYVSEMTVENTAVYNSETNAAGGTVIDYLCRKYRLEIGVICLDEAITSTILNAITNEAANTIQFYCPETKALKSGSFYIEGYSVEYYTLQNTTKKTKEFTLEFVEL